MSILINVVRSLTVALKWMALATIGFMMLLITTGVIGRAFGKPIIGDVELVQVMMIVVIMCGLAFSQSENAHISIGLLVDKFSLRVQSYFDIGAYMMTFIICFIIGWVFIESGIDDMFGSIRSTDMLEIPHYPFKFIIAIGFILWGLEALLKVVLTSFNLVNGVSTKLKEEEHGRWI